MVRAVATRKKNNGITAAGYLDKPKGVSGLVQGC